MKKLPTEEKFLNLTICDWEEIYYALESKIQAVKNDGYQESPEWLAHLREIMKKIGDDGRHAIRLTRATDCKHKHNEEEAV